jgi:polar amino acid transport system substrate-binding protein
VPDKVADTVFFPRLTKAVVVLVALTIWQSSARADSCDIRMSYGSYPPYSIVSPQGPMGIDIELIEIIARHAGCHLHWTAMPWARTLHEIEAGTMDAVGNVTRTPARERFAYYIGPYRDDTMVLVVPAGTHQAGTVRDIIEAHGHVGIVLDYAYGNEVAALMADPIRKGGFYVNTSDDSNLRMLAAGRLQATIASQYVATQMLDRMDTGHKLQLTPTPVFSEPQYLIFSRHSVSAETAARFQRAVEAAQQDGSLKLILDRIPNP